jgi:hypothetical protein
VARIQSKNKGTASGSAPLLPASRKGGCDTQANKRDTTDIALELEIAASALQPTACCPGSERITPIGDEPEKREEQSQHSNLHCHMPSAYLNELRQEGEKEQRGLGIEKINNEPVAKQAPISVLNACKLVL